MKRIKILAGILMVVVIAICLLLVKNEFFKNDRIKPAQPVTTNAVTAFTDTTAIFGGNIIDADTLLYTERGVVFAVTPNPTTANSKIQFTGSETGSFNVNVSGLKPNTRYYVRAYAVNSEGTVYGAQVRFTTTDVTNATYILDDGKAETNLGYFDNNSIGNQFYVGEEGVLTSIDVYAQNRSDNISKPAVIDIYNAQRQLVNSSAPFAFAGNDWVTVPLQNVPYAGIFYVMVRWTASELGSYGLGYDTGGTYAEAGFNWLRDNNGNWSLLHEASSQYTPGIFMIRANANTSGTGTVKAIRRLPAVTTIAATAITATTVVISGTVVNDGTPAYIERGIAICTHTNPSVTCAAKTAVAGKGTGSFSTTVSGLRANTPYFARTYATTAEGTVYGNEITFTTLDSNSLPSLTTSAATNITATSATFDGNVINEGTPAYIERGVVYCTHTNPTVANCTKIVSTGTGIGSFSADANVLRSNTTYYARTYAINADGTFYGNEINFTTPAVKSDEETEATNEEAPEPEQTP